MDKLKYIKFEESQGQYTNSIPIGVDSKNVDLKTGNNLEEILGNYDLSEGTIEDRLKKTNIDKTLTKQNTAAEAKAVGQAINILNKNKIIEYKTAIEMIEDNEISNDIIVKTLGYYSINDGGAATYQITKIKPDSYYEQLNNHLYAKLIFDKNILYTAQFGCHSDKITDDTEKFQYIVDYALEHQINKVIINNYMLITEPIYIYNHVNGFTMEGIAKVPSQNPVTTLPDQKYGIYFIPKNNDNTVVFKLGLPKKESDFLSRVINKPGMVFKNFIIRNGEYISGGTYPNEMTAFQIYNDDARFINLLIIGADYGFIMPQKYTYNSISVSNYCENLLFSGCQIKYTKKRGIVLYQNDNSVIQKCGIDTAYDSFEYAITLYQANAISINNLMLGTPTSQAENSHDAWIHIARSTGKIDGIYIENIGKNNTLFNITHSSRFNISNIKTKFDFKYILTLYDDSIVKISNIQNTQLPIDKTSVIIVDTGTNYSNPSFCKMQLISCYYEDSSKVATVIPQLTTHFGGFAYFGDSIVGKIYINGIDSYRYILNGCNITSRIDFNKITPTILSLSYNINNFNPILVSISNSTNQNNILPQIIVNRTDDNNSLIQFRENNSLSIQNIDSITGIYNIIIKYDI